MFDTIYNMPSAKKNKFLYPRHPEGESNQNKSKKKYYRKVLALAMCPEMRLRARPILLDKCLTYDEEKLHYNFDEFSG